MLPSANVYNYYNNVSVNMTHHHGMGAPRKGSFNSTGGIGGGSMWGGLGGQTAAAQGGAGGDQKSFLGGEELSLGDLMGGFGK